MEFKNYNEVLNWLEENTKHESYGFYIETNLGNKNKIFFIYKHLGLNECNSDEPLYMFDSVKLNGIIVDTFQCSHCGDLFKNGAEFINFIAEEDVILKLGNEQQIKQYKRHKFLVDTIKNNINFEYFNENDLLKIILDSGTCTTNDFCEKNINKNSCFNCWKKHLDSSIK